MQRLAYACLVVLSVVLFREPALAYTNPGNPTGYVNDYAHVLSENTKHELENELTLFAASTSNEVSVAVIPTLGGDYIEHYSAQLLKDWGIGTKVHDNGVLLLVAVAEHKLRIEVGYGLEGALPDSVAQRIINDEIVPSLKTNDYDIAITSGVHNIELAIQNEYQGVPTQALPKVRFGNLGALILLPFIILQWLAAVLARSRSFWAGGVLGAIFGSGLWWGLGLTTAAAVLTVGGLAVFGLLFDYIVSRGYNHAQRHGGMPPWWTGGGGFGGGSTGGGFGGFGGGRSGGGGASGSW